jgi:hypothetical protein
MASVLDQYGITIITDPATGAQTIATWGSATTLVLTWSINGTASDQMITNQAQAVQVLRQAAANLTPHVLINAVLVSPQS